MKTETKFDTDIRCRKCNKFIGRTRKENNKPRGYICVSCKADAESKRKGEV